MAKLAINTVSTDLDKKMISLVGKDVWKIMKKTYKSWEVEDCKLLNGNVLETKLHGEIQRTPLIVELDIMIQELQDMIKDKTNSADKEECKRDLAILINTIKMKLG